MDNQVRVLLVDDEEPLLTALGAELREAGYEVGTADDGDIAISLLQKEQFDIVLLDIRMPRVNGIDVLKFIKQNTPATKVVMLTGVADLKLAMDSKRYGAEDFIEKPYVLENLLFKLRQVKK